MTAGSAPGRGIQAENLIAVVNLGSVTIGDQDDGGHC